MTSSSPRSASEFDAILIAEECIVGPILLPEKRGLAFVEEFNRTYERVGLKIEPMEDRTKESL